MIVVVLAVALVATIGTAAAMLAVRATDSSGRVTLSGQVTDLANAGLSQAVRYLRTAGPGGLATAGTAWTQASPQTVAAGEGSYRVWIEPVVAWPAPPGNPAIYRIHSTGLVGAGRREVTADVSLRPVANLPFGVLGTNVALGGTSQLVDTSVFSTGCIGGRTAGNITGTDPYRNIPAAAHSSNYVSQRAQQPSAPTSCTQDQSIHNAATVPSTAPCNPDFPYDHDNAGGPVAAFPACAGKPVENTSYLADKADLLRMFGLAPGLTLEQQEALKAAAQTQGNYFTDARPGSAAYGFASDPAHAIYFYEINGGVVDLKDFDGSRWLDGATCENESLVIVVRGGSARLNGNVRLRAHVFLIPRGGGETGAEGDWDKGNGTAGLTGSLMGDDIDLRGNGSVELDACAVRNVPPALFDLRIDDYAELDR